MATFPRGKHLTTNDVRLHYLEFGSAGQPLLLLPGITSPAITWAFVSERLAQWLHVYTLDIRGRGLSEQRPGLGYRLNDYALDAKGVIEKLGLKRPIVLGHSMGARIAVKLGAIAPDLVGKLVLVDPPVSGPGRRPYPTPLPWYIESSKEAAHGANIEAMRKLLPSWTDDQLALRAQWLPTCTVEGIVESHKSFHDEDMHADLPKLRCPTLLIRAGKGDVIRDDDAKEIESLIPDCRTVTIEKAGHMIPWDDLEGFIAAVRVFTGSAA